ncbi:MAG TPA: Nif3-like dinuclear metal center hexameric protein [Longimicrobiales bacterium]
MAVVKTRELSGYLDDYLKIGQVPDSDQALNGLQVENGGEVRRVAAAVDASERTIRRAAELGCDFLLVHHGLFWDGNIPATGARYRKLKTLLDAGTALYGAHIPLDLHPEVGNNVVLARELGLEIRGGFGQYKGVEIGVWGDLELSREALTARLDDVLGCRVKLIAGGPELLHRVGIITGSGAAALPEAVAMGLDALITGEGNHHTYFAAEESGINLYYGGHYATETWGVKALAHHLQERFDLPWEFIDHPTGL